MSLAVSASDAMLATDPSSASFIQMINGVNLKGTMTQDVDNTKADMQMAMSFNGMTIDFSLLMDGPENMVLQSPLLEKIVLLTPKTDTPAPAIDKEKMKSLNKEITDYIVGFLTDDEITVEKNVAYTGKDGDAKLKMLTITLSSDRVYEFVNGIIPVVYSNDYIKDIMKPSIQQQLEMNGDTATDEEISAEIDKLPTTLQDALVQSKDFLKFTDMTIKMGVDKNYNTPTSTVKLGMVISNPDAIDETVTMGIDYKIDSYAFDQPVTVTMPELTDDNTMSMEDFMMQLMFGMMGALGQ